MSLFYFTFQEMRLMFCPKKNVIFILRHKLCIYQTILQDGFDSRQ